MPELPGRPKQVETPRVFVETYESVRATARRAERLAAAEAAVKAAEAAAKSTPKKEAH